MSKEQIEITIDPKNPPQITEEERNLYRENNIPVITPDKLVPYLKAIRKLKK